MLTFEQPYRGVRYLMLLLLCGGCSSTNDSKEKGEITSANKPRQNWKKAEAHSAEGTECQGESGSRCLGANGVSGTCLFGFCLADGPGCIKDIDCYDGNECTHERCDSGKCVANFTKDRCEVASKPGACNQGKCILEGNLACSKDKDCKPIATPCADAFCAEGICDQKPLEQGESCEMHSAAPGVCNEKLECVLDPVVAQEGAERCQMKWVWNGYRRVKKKKCRKGIRYTISADRILKEREKIRKAIEKEVRYDTHVGLIQSGDGGYNITVTNARRREDIRGLVDPSFIAFSLASFTAKTNWKSRNLNIWLNPLNEGWYIPTSGSRKAIRKGRAASVLGRWGVVDVKTYRKWLEKNFKPMPIPLD